MNITFDYIRSKVWIIVSKKKNRLFDKKKGQEKFEEQYSFCKKIKKKYNAYNKILVKGKMDNINNNYLCFNIVCT